MARQQASHCSFCGKSQDQVKRLIGGPNHIFICDQCVALCNEIIAEGERNQGFRPPRPPGSQGGGTGSWRATTREPTGEEGE